MIENGYLIIRLDNCEDQYKCMFTFYQMQVLAVKHNIDIFWFYGAAGHGKGLIDAMSSFGCKRQLRHAIVAEDIWLPTALSMVYYLKQYFKERNHLSEVHYHIEERRKAN